MLDDDDRIRRLFQRTLADTAPFVSPAKHHVLDAVLGVLEPRTLEGRYHIGPRLGAGGMGVVHRGRDTRLERDVAIKRVHRTATAAADLAARLEQEARTLASLSHPNIVTVHDVFVEDGELHVVMELVEGRSARAWLAQRERSWQDVVSLYERAGRGLAAAHAAGIVHRDFKPTNVMVGDHGAVVKVIDFGLARTADDGPTHSGQGDPGSRRSWTQGAGTLPYMAPEQRTGETEPASDQYGLCVSLYEGLVGERPFRPDDEPGVRTDADRQRLARALARSGVPRRIRAAIVRGLAADPRARFRAMDELLAQLAPSSSKRSGWAVAAAGTLGLAATLSLRPGDPCDAMDAAASELWTAERRAAVERHAPDLGREVDRFVATWRAQAHAQCEAEPEDAAGREQAARRRLCLQRTLARVDVFLHAVTDDALSRDGLVRFEDAASLDCDGGWDLVAATPATFAAADRETLREVDEIYVQALDDDAAAQAALLEGLLDRRATQAPIRTWASARLGHLYGVMGRREAAVRLLERAMIEAEAGDDPVLRGLVQVELAANLASVPGREAEALGLARRAVAALEATAAGEPFRPGAQGALAVAALRSGEPAVALEAAARGSALLDARPASSPSRARVAELARAQLANLRAMAEEESGRASQALASYREAAERIGRTWPRHPDRARILGNLGRLERGMGRLDLAEDHLQQAIAIAREQGLATLAATTAMNLGNAMLAAERLDRALAIYDEARALLPDDASVHVRADLAYNRAIALQRLGRASEAAEGYADVLASLARGPGDPHVRHGAHLGRGLALLELGRSELAQRDLTDALALEPEDVAAEDAIDLRMGLALALPAEERARIADLVEQARGLAGLDAARARQLEAWRARFVAAARGWPGGSD